ALQPGREHAPANVVHDDPPRTRDLCGSLSAAWPGPVTARRRGSVATTAKETRPGRSGLSERARLRSDAVFDQQFAKGNLVLLLVAGTADLDFLARVRELPGKGVDVVLD